MAADPAFITKEFSSLPWRARVTGHHFHFAQGKGLSSLRPV